MIFKVFWESKYNYGQYNLVSFLQQDTSFSEGTNTSVSSAFSCEVIRGKDPQSASPTLGCCFPFIHAFI